MGNKVLKQESKDHPMVKSECEMDVGPYLIKFQTEAAGYIVDELPNYLVNLFLIHLQKKNTAENNLNGNAMQINPFMIAQKVDENDPHLYEETKKNNFNNDDKKRGIEQIKQVQKPTQAPIASNKKKQVSGQSTLSFKKSN